MTLDDQTRLQGEWWESLQLFDVPKVKRLFAAHPHLLWLKRVDPVNIPTTFVHQLASSLDNLSALQWLLFYYDTNNDAKSLITFILNKTTAKELDDDIWGDQNNTTLHLVCALGYEDLAIQLLQKGARADIANAQGRLPIDVAQTETMVTLLDSKLQQPTKSSSATLDSSIPTLKAPNKDQHYFRAGQVERTKQKVLTDEQVELEKQRERRRKDIAILAKRSAVKNNPFVKNAEPAQISSSGIRSRHDSTSVSNGDSTLDNAAHDSSSLGDRKHKRNSKVINSLQTKSYVSSSIFRQGQPTRTSRPKNLNLTPPLQQEQPAPIQTEDSNSQTMDTPIASPISDTPIASPISDTPVMSKNGSSNSSVNSDHSSSGHDHDNTSTKTEQESDNISEHQQSSLLEKQDELSTKTEIPDSEMPIDLLMGTSSNNTNTKRQSGSQKTNWAKELTSWESVIEREFDLGNKDIPSPSSLDSDDKKQQDGLGDQCRRQGTDNTIFEGSRLPLKSYGSVSVRSMATYSRRLPTPAFDTATNKKEDPPVTLSQTAISLPKQSPSYTDRKITRSISVSDLSPTPPNDSHHEQQKQPSHKPLQNPATLNPISSFNLANCGRGKLYIRVHGVHDILLPLPRDRAHVRCVIGDGRYEYMSRYETLAQDITFGYECIIDSHPEMIVTLSLHVRPDYMLKKPLTRLFSSNRKRKGSLSAYVSNEDGAIGQTRFAVGDMLGACHRRSYSASFHCFNAWYVHSRDKPARQQESDQGVLKVVGNFKVEMLYLPVSDPSLPVPKNLREIDMAIKIQQWNDTRFDNDLPKIQRPPPRVA